MKSRRFLPVLLLLFVGSGCAALIYEVVWLQLLQLVIGRRPSRSECCWRPHGWHVLGSLLLPRLVGPNRHPLRIYAILELGIGLMAVTLAR
jgi:spermidine synthase